MLLIPILLMLDNAQENRKFGEQLNHQIEAELILTQEVKDLFLAQRKLSEEEFANMRALLGPPPVYNPLAPAPLKTLKAEP